MSSFLNPDKKPRIECLPNGNTILRPDSEGMYSGEQWDLIWADHEKKKAQKALSEMGTEKKVDLIVDLMGASRIKEVREAKKD